jgi:hypothetical protein
MRNALAALLLMLLAVPASAGALDPDYLKGDHVIRLTYAYGSEEEIPGSSGVHYVAPLPGLPPVPVSHGPEFSEHDAVGMSYSYFLENDLAVEGALSVPLGAAGSQNLNASLGLDYYFGRFFIPLQLGYRGQLDSPYFASGAGFDWLVNGTTSLRLTATAGYLTDSDLAESWDWTSEAAVGWTF